MFSLFKKNINRCDHSLIKSVIGDKYPQPLGWMVLVEIYHAGETHLLDGGEESVFVRPDKTKEADSYKYGTGRILLMGSVAFKAECFKDWDLIPKVGDWIDFARGDGVFRTYNGVETISIKDFSAINVVPDPSIEGYHQFIGN